LPAPVANRRSRPIDAAIDRAADLSAPFRSACCRVAPTSHMHQNRYAHASNARYSPYLIDACKQTARLKQAARALQAASVRAARQHCDKRGQTSVAADAAEDETRNSKLHRSGCRTSARIVCYPYRVGERCTSSDRCCVHLVFQQCESKISDYQQSAETQICPCSD
jgi:hypothetical protein